MDFYWGRCKLKQRLHPSGLFILCILEEQDNEYSKRNLQKVQGRKVGKVGKSEGAEALRS